MCQYDIACLQETWLGNRDTYILTDSMIFRSDRPLGRVGGGTAIFCRKQLDPTYLILPWLETLGIEYTAILVHAINRNNKTLAILTIYKPSNLNLGRNKWKIFFNKLKDLNTEYQLLVCGDFNAQHPAWGSSITNSDGTSIANLLLSSDFICLNNDSVTRISVNVNLSSVPDLTLCSIELSGGCTWSTLDDAMGSDHIPIHIELSEDLYNFQDTMALYRPKLLASKFNKDTFLTMVDLRMKTINGPWEKGSDIYDA